jgi:hypothetical protein
MAHHVAAFHARDDAAVDMQIRAADRARRHLDDGVARVFDFRIGNFIATDIGFAMPSERLHAELLQPLWTLRVEATPPSGDSSEISMRARKNLRQCQAANT